MSPVIWPVPASEPTQCFGFRDAWGGTSSATGSPKRVTRTGLPVLRTLSSTARQVALNLEMAISSIVEYPFLNSTMVSDHGQSKCTLSTIFPARAIWRIHHKQQ